MNDKIDDILRVLDDAKLKKQIGATVQMALYDKMYEESQGIKSQQITGPVQYKQNKQSTINPKKSIRNPITPVRKAIICSVVDEILEEIKKHPIFTTLVASALALGLLVSIPNIKTTSQINELTTSYSAQLEESNLGESNGIFSKIKLTISPSEFVESRKLTSSSHMRLYILSTVIQDSDFNAILKELGYRGFDDYINKLGFRHTEDFRAGEHYSREREKNLEDLIKEINKNRDLLPQYLEMYPELGFIYDVRDENQAMSTTNNGRGH